MHVVIATKASPIRDAISVALVRNDITLPVNGWLLLSLKPLKSLINAFQIVAVGLADEWQGWATITNSSAAFGIHHKKSRVSYLQKLLPLLFIFTTL